MADEKGLEETVLVLQLFLPRAGDWGALAEFLLVHNTSVCLLWLRYSVGLVVTAVCGGIGAIELGCYKAIISSTLIICMKTQTCEDILLQRLFLRKSISLKASCETSCHEC